MANVPSWLWFLIALILILVFLLLIGVRVHVGSSFIILAPLMASRFKKSLDT